MSNRLKDEKSPYLLQHAENPVDWYPWGNEAFEKAREMDRPIFLSIGYSTCHWCHVMERESFEDDEVAELMNKTFVSIKVDREERPDIDNIYMTVCHVVSRRGCGWPLNIVMTSEGKPFFAGTYMPKENRHGRIGMKEFVPAIKELWDNKRDEVLESARQITDAVSSLGDSAHKTGGYPLSEKTLDQAYSYFLSTFDSKDSGFGGAPKFPTPHNIMFLMRYYRRTAKKTSLQMAEKTLLAMARGGIYDHVGFGFHRYSTDSRWLVPHFEKMLYDQALLTITYTEAWQITKNPFYQKKAREILEYLIRDMTSPEGGIYSAEDADSEGEEGRFYLWTVDELERLIGVEDTELLSDVYNLSRYGNFTDEVTGEQSDRNIFHLEEPLAKIAARRKISEKELEKKLEGLREKLFARRESRVHPYKDDKVLTDWNGIAIVALSKASAAFGEKRYSDAALDSIEFVRQNLFHNGRLLHRYRDGESGIMASVDDYTFLIWGLLEYYEAVFDEKYLSLAISLCRDQFKHFWDEEVAGFYFTADDGEELITRQKEIYDGAVPSGNSVSMLNILRIARLTADPELEEKAARMATSFSPQISKHPASFSMHMNSLDFMLGPSFEIVIAGEKDSPDTRRFLEVLSGEVIPKKGVILKDEPNGKKISAIAPYTQNHKSLDGKATAYVCSNYQCHLPTDDPQRMLSLIRGAEKQ
ncbi:MAG: thioredoxin domain-containing protein [Candidatus Dadabacteria bacterium]|nr:thioredoxin domain-containing protein [Candidatus Dadabacteria bacterium]